MQSETADFAPVLPPGELDEKYASSVIMCKHDVIHKTHCDQNRTETEPHVTCTENLVKFAWACGSWDASGRTNRQTNRQTCR